jgi:hypothetical protein
MIPALSCMSEQHTSKGSLIPCCGMMIDPACGWLLSMVKKSETCVEKAVKFLLN